MTRFHNCDGNYDNKLLYFIQFNTYYVPPRKISFIFPKYNLIRKKLHFNLLSQG